MTIVKDELAEVRQLFATPRLTEIVDYDSSVEDEDLIQKEDMVVTVSHAGYVKRVPLSTYRSQRRGGKGRSGMATRDEDFVTRLFVANTHTPVLFFSSQGQAYKEKVWRLPMAAPNARGKALVNILQLQDTSERITTIMPLPEDEASWETLDVMFATASGSVRRNKLSDFTTVNRNGKIAMKLDEGDHIVHVEICRPDQNVLLTTALGQCIRFPVEDVRVFKGRDSTGVRGINLAQGDRVISMTILNAFDATAEERAGYLKMRRAVMGDTEEGAEEPEEGAEAAAISPSATPRWARPSNTCSRFPSAASASGPRPSSTGPRVGAEKASPRCGSTPATATSWRPSRSRRRTRSCWSRMAASSSACRWTTSASSAAPRRA